MSGLLSELRLKWEVALASSGSGHEWRAVALSTGAPVKLLAGVRDRDGRVSVLIETTIRHAPKNRIRFQAEGISLVDERCAEESLLRLAVTLERIDLRDVFEVLATDLVMTASNSLTPEQTIRQIIRRLEAWQACLQARQRGLSREEQIGLLGELTVMQQIAKEIGLPRTIAAWLGPLDGTHDFMAAGVAIEVKATIGFSRHIHITGLDQLDCEGLDTLTLVRARFRESIEGSTLSEVVNTLRRQLAQNHPSAVSEFEEKLMRAGYLDTDSEVYSKTTTELQDLLGFNVREGFPKLTGATVPPAVVDAAYSLDERQILPFRLEGNELRAVMQRMGAHE